MLIQDIWAKYWPTYLICVPDRKSTYLSMQVLHWNICLNLVASLVLSTQSGQDGSTIFLTKPAHSLIQSFSIPSFLYLFFFFFSSAAFIFSLLHFPFSLHYLDQQWTEKTDFSHLTTMPFTSCFALPSTSDMLSSSQSHVATLTLPATSLRHPQAPGCALSLSPREKPRSAGPRAGALTCLAHSPHYNLHLQRCSHSLTPSLVLGPVAKTLSL